MKIVTEDNSNFDIYINKIYQKEIDFEDLEGLEKYFKNLFLKLKKYYDIIISGFYEIKIFNNQDYGIIIRIENDDFDYCDYFKDQIDMRISIEKNAEFLYEIKDIFNIKKNVLSKGNLIKYKNKIYFKTNNISDIELGEIIENSIIVFDEMVDLIIKKGKKIVL